MGEQGATYAENRNGILAVVVYHFIVVNFADGTPNISHGEATKIEVGATSRDIFYVLIFVLRILLVGRRPQQAATSLMLKRWSVLLMSRSCVAMLQLCCYV